MSRRHPEKKRRPTTITIPARVSAHVKLVFAEMRRQGITYDEVQDGSGVLRTTIKAWRSKNKPGLESIEAVLGFLGWNFVAVPRERVLPKPLVVALKAVAEAHGETLDTTFEYLIAVVAGVHARFPAPSSRQPSFGTGESLPTQRKRLPKGCAHPDQFGFLAEASSTEQRVTH